MILEGSATGHRHELTAGSDGTLYAVGDEWVLEVAESGATITHPEHGPIRLKQGTYRIWRQREFVDPAQNRYVVD